MCERCLDAAGQPSASRRGFLVAALGLVAGGCARPALVTPMPRPPWPEARPPEPLPPRAEAPRAAPAAMAGVLPRSAWARGGPMPARMNRMTTIRYVTVHHDGMDPFYAGDVKTVAAHLERIRRMHRQRGWGDIGYHFAVDRAGRVWQARPLRFQGAHVKDHNPGNVGIVVLGNFEQQTPTTEQVAGVQRHLRALMRAFAIPLTGVQTHQEWGARTLCPGRRLQERLERLRHGGGLG